MPSQAGAHPSKGRSHNPQAPEQSGITLDYPQPRRDNRMPAESLKIRPYLPSDHAPLMALWNTVFPDDPPWNEPGKCNDPVKFCSSVNLGGVEHDEHGHGRRNQAMDSQA